MRVSIGRSDIHGRVKAPSSKSYTIRGLMCAALAHGTSELVYPLGSDDTEAAGVVLGKIGVEVVYGTDRWQVAGGNLHTPDSDLFCRESAATLRFMAAIAATISGGCRLTATPSLMRRPLDPLLDALRQLGVKCTVDTGNSSITVNGGGLKGGITSLPGNISSQFVSALLLVGPLVSDGMTIRLTTQLESRPYVEMTIESLQQFGVTVEPSRDYREFHVKSQTYKPARYVVEGDWSSASYLLALGAVGGETRVENLKAGSLQGDKMILDFLRKMGAEVIISSDSVVVKKSLLKPIKADLTDSIDLLPTVAVLAALAEGESEFTGIARGRLKESDRVASVKSELEKAGIEVREDHDRLTVIGSKPHGAVFESHGDHRIAMAFSLLGVAVGDTVVEGGERVSKTYPEYWDVLASLGGKVGLHGR